MSLYIKYKLYIIKHDIKNIHFVLLTLPEFVNFLCVLFLLCV